MMFDNKAKKNKCVMMMDTKEMKSKSMDYDFLKSKKKDSKMKMFN